MGTLGAEALLIGKSPWLAAPGWGWHRGLGGGGVALATSSLSQQPEQKSPGREVDKIQIKAAGMQGLRGLGHLCTAAQPRKPSSIPSHSQILSGTLPRIHRLFSS